MTTSCSYETNFNRAKESAHARRDALGHRNRPLRHVDVWQHGALPAALAVHPPQDTHRRRRCGPRSAGVLRYILPGAGRAGVAVEDAETLRPCEHPLLSHEKRHPKTVSLVGLSTSALGAPRTASGVPQPQLARGFTLPP